jgi:hypothetical protein
MVSVVLGGAGPPGAARATTFEGTCRLSGELKFAESLGNDLRLTTTDTLTFDRRLRLRITTEDAGGLTQFAGRFAGAVSGDGVVEVNALPFTDQSTLAACQAGTLTGARYDLVARTITPVVG